MIVNYTVRAGDSLTRIAQLYGVTTSTLVSYNSLTWPYITDDPTVQGAIAIPASGPITLTFTNPLATTVDVPAGFLVGSPLLGTTQLRKYWTVQESSIPAGATSGSLTVQCTTPGLFGNVSATYISIILTTSVFPSGTTVTNPNPFVNGVNKSALLPGDILQIPNPTVLNATEVFQQPLPGTQVIVGGSDLAWNFATGDLVVEASGDYQLVAGVDNIGTNIIGRIITSKGALPFHPTYGTSLMSQVSNNPAIAQKLLTLDITESLLADPDVAAVTDLKVTPQGTALYVTGQVLLRSSQYLTFSTPIVGGI